MPNTDITASGNHGGYLHDTLSILLLGIFLCLCAYACMCVCLTFVSLVRGT